MFAAFDNFPSLLIWLPLVAGVLSFFIKKEGAPRNISLLSSILSLAIVIASLLFSGQQHSALNQVSYIWMPDLGSSFGFILDGLTKILCLLTAIVFPLVLLVINKDDYKNSNAFYGLLMLTQCGLMGVFMATDALVFYFFWELALIPVYFLSSIWGGEKRIKATFKFFIYTFIGSLFLLIGILYLYLKTPHQSFNLAAFYNLRLSAPEQHWLFFLFFIAFAIKMPIFPLHTWQPDAYEQAPRPVTMIMSSIMVKMGVFGLIRWLLPLFPLAIKDYNTGIILLISVGMIYASLIAIYQDSIKRLIAYSSIAHIGLMAAGIFSLTEVALEGVILQMFNHGINIVALWIAADFLERQTGVTQISQLGGVAQKAPKLTIFLVIAAMANIALPLTNAFVGEFTIFNGLYKFNPWLAALAGVSIILSAVYTLNMIKNIFYGEVVPATTDVKDIGRTHMLVFSIITLLVFVVGIYPSPIFKIIQESTAIVLNKYGSL
jgi:NADH-quinone oxidoreductase subunit M